MDKPVDNFHKMPQPVDKPVDNCPSLWINLWITLINAAYVSVPVYLFIYILLVYINYIFIEHMRVCARVHVMPPCGPRSAALRATPATSCGADDDGIMGPPSRHGSGPPASPPLTSRPHQCWRYAMTAGIPPPGSRVAAGSQHAGPPGPTRQSPGHWHTRGRDFDHYRGNLPLRSPIRPITPEARVTTSFADTVAGNSENFWP